MSQKCSLIANVTNPVLGHIARNEASRSTEEVVLEISVTLGSLVLKECVDTGEEPADDYEGQEPRLFSFQKEAEEAGLV